MNTIIIQDLSLPGVQKPAAEPIVYVLDRRTVHVMTEAACTEKFAGGSAEVFTSWKAVSDRINAGLTSHELSVEDVEPMLQVINTATFVNERFSLESDLAAAGLVADSIAANAPGLLRNIFNFLQYAQDLRTHVEAFILDAVTDVLALQYQHEFPTDDLSAFASGLADDVDDVSPTRIEVRGRVFEKEDGGWVAVVSTLPAGEVFSHRETDEGSASSLRITRYVLPAYCQSALNYVAENF